MSNKRTFRRAGEYPVAPTESVQTKAEVETELTAQLDSGAIERTLATAQVPVTYINTPEKNFADILMAAVTDKISLDQAEELFRKMCQAIPDHELADVDIAIEFLVGRIKNNLDIVYYRFNKAMPK